VAAVVFPLLLLDFSAVDKNLGNRKKRKEKIVAFYNTRHSPKRHVLFRLVRDAGRHTHADIHTHTHTHT
jgi:hypothetical protein